MVLLGGVSVHCAMTLVFFRLMMPKLLAGMGEAGDKLL